MPSRKTDNDSDNNCSLRKNTGHLDKIEEGEKSRSPKYVVFTISPIPHSLFKCANGGNTAKKMSNTIQCSFSTLYLSYLC